MTHLKVNDSGWIASINSSFIVKPSIRAVNSRELINCSGRVVDWSIHGLKTASGATGSEIDSEFLSGEGEEEGRRTHDGGMN